MIGLKSLKTNIMRIITILIPQLHILYSVRVINYIIQIKKSNDVSGEWISKNLRES